MGHALRFSSEQYEAMMKNKKAKKSAEAKPALNEHQEQCALHRWWREWGPLNGYSVKLLFAIPNAGALSVNGRIYKWDEGLTSGVYDLFLAIPRNGKGGLFIEMKAGKNKPSDAQNEFQKAIAADYENAVCYSGSAAIDLITRYLKG